MTIIRFLKQKRFNVTHLAVHELEDLDRDVVELVVDRSDNALNRSLHGLNPGLQRTGLVLRVTVGVRQAHQSVDRCHLHELQVLQPLLLLLVNLYQTMKIQLKLKNLI